MLKYHNVRFSPEIHRAQYPLNLGKKRTVRSSAHFYLVGESVADVSGTSQTNSNTLALQVDQDGTIR